MDNIIETKSFTFAVRIVNLYKMLTNDRKEYVLSKQLLKSGTSIGANVSEAEQAQSRADFRSKLGIALKEAVETDYWLRLLYATEYLTPQEFQSIHSDCKKKKKMLTSIIKSSKEEK